MISLVSSLFSTLFVQSLIDLHLCLEVIQTKHKTFILEKNVTMFSCLSFYHRQCEQWTPSMASFVKFSQHRKVLVAAVESLKQGRTTKDFCRILKFIYSSWTLPFEIASDCTKYFQKRGNHSAPANKSWWSVAVVEFW